MDAIDRRLREFGYESLWAWLFDHPDMHWVDVGKALGFIPVAVMEKCAREAPSFPAAVRQSLMRNIRRYFPDGWDASATFQRAHLGAKVGTELDIDVPVLRNLLDRIDRLPAGWRPVGVDDPDLVAVTDGLFEGPRHAGAPDS